MPNRFHQEFPRALQPHYELLLTMMKVGIPGTMITRLFLHYLVGVKIFAKSIGASSRLPRCGGTQGPALLCGGRWFCDAMLRMMRSEQISRQVQQQKEHAQTTRWKGEKEN
jgi:hypothetical protein